MWAQEKKEAEDEETTTKEEGCQEVLEEGEVYEDLAEVCEVMAEEVQVASDPDELAAANAHGTPLLGEESDAEDKFKAEDEELKPHTPTYTLPNNNTNIV